MTREHILLALVALLGFTLLVVMVLSLLSHSADTNLTVALRGLARSAKSRADFYEKTWRESLDDRISLAQIRLMLDVTPTRYVIEVADWGEDFEVTSLGRWRWAVSDCDGRTRMWLHQRDSAAAYLAVGNAKTYDDAVRAARLFIGTHADREDPMTLVVV